MAHRFLAIGLIISGLLITNCASIHDIVQKPTVQVAAVRLGNLSLSAATLHVDLKVDNPNPVGVTVRNVAYDLKINNKNLLKGTADQGVHLPSAGSEIVELPLQVNYFDLYDSVLELFAHANVPYDLSGSVGIGPFDIPYHTAGELPIPKLPVVRLKNVEIATISFSGADLVFTLGLKNSNSFAVDVNEVACDIKLGGKTFAEGLARRVDPMMANSETLLEVALRVSFFDLGRSAYQLLLEPSTGYELTGEMRLKKPGRQEAQIPFKIDGNVGLGR
jgi:LEA14-like dessication related protein